MAPRAKPQRLASKPSDRKPPWTGPTPSISLEDGNWPSDHAWRHRFISGRILSILLDRCNRPARWGRVAPADRHAFLVLRFGTLKGRHSSVRRVGYNKAIWA